MTDSSISVEQAEILYEALAHKGKPYPDDSLSDNTHYTDTIESYDGQPTGNSRISGDADLQTQLYAMQAIVNAGVAADLSTHDIAYVLAIAKVESGFNPDAAAGTSSATGLGQFIDTTGATYGLNDSNRWNVNAQANALVNEFVDLKAQVAGNDQSEDYIYAYHHDGASSSDPATGLAISDSAVMPQVAAFEYYLDTVSAEGETTGTFWPSDLLTASTIGVSGLNVPLNTCVVPPSITAALTPWATAPTEGSPLVIDLSSGHTGITLSEFNASTTTTFFDLEGTGYAVQTAWTSGDTTGFLVDDLNSNGKIDNVGEMFGSPTVDGFAKLAILDSNHDLKIDSHDADWSSLQVWIDANGDGVTQDGELHSLASLGIVSIDLAGVASSTSVVDGNPISHTSTVTFTGGATATIADAWLVHDGTDSYYNGSYTLDSDTLFLPDLRGYGTVADLTIAMSQDSTLKGLVSDFASGFSLSSFADPSTLDSDVASILYRWAGVDGVASDARGPSVDAQQLEFLEHLFDQAFQQGPYTDPAPQAAHDINESWGLVFNDFKADLLLQSGAATLFDGPVTYNPWTGTITGDPHLSESAITTLAGDAPGTDAAAQAFWLGIAQFVNSTEGFSNITTDEHTWLDSAVTATTTVGWDDIVNLANGLNAGSTINGTSGNDTLTGGSGDDTINGLAGDDTIHGGAGADTISGGDGNDTLYGESGNDTLIGGAGADILYGGDGNDILWGNSGSGGADGDNTLSGGAGGNFLHGGAGNDTYIYTAGADDFIIEQEGGTDQIILPSGIDLGDLSFSRVDGTDAGHYYDLLITFSGGGSIQIQDQFRGSNYQVETLVFSDTSTVNLTSLTDLTFVGTNGDNSITVAADSGNSTILGLDGADSITVHNGNNTIDGGNGNDTIDGGSGNDTYIASPGFDTINETSGGTDTIVVPVGYSADDVTFSRHIGPYGPDNGLMIDIHGLGEIYLPYQFYGGGYTLENMHFLGDSSTISLTDQVIQTIGTSGNDTLYGVTSSAGGNWFDGRGGSDTIVNGIGDNTYVFSVGFGNQTVSQSYHAGTNVLDFVGIDPSHIRMWTDSYGTLHLQDTTDPTHSITVSAATTGSGTAESAIGSYLEQINFDDSGHTSWDLTGGLALTGDNSGDYIYGTAYGDTITGGTGNDTIYGNGGADTLVSGGGTDYLYGGAGNDIYVFASGFGNSYVTDNSASGANVIHLAGIDPSHIHMVTDYSGALYIEDTTNPSYHLTIYAGTTGSGTYESTIGTYFSQVTFDSGYSTTWDLTGGLTLTGDNSGDYIYGTAYGDTITGGTGNDTIYGNGGADTLVSGGGTDYLYGGAGNDTYVFASGFGNSYVTDNSASGANVIHLAGIDPSHIHMVTDYSGALYIEDTTNPSYHLTVYAGTTGSGMYESTIGTYFSQVTFDTGYSTTWDLTGGLTLTDDNSGGYLYGTANNDTLTGGTGADYIYGNHGNDVLYGGGGYDTLTGGAGADTFLFKAATALAGGTATIADFSTSDGDKIDISDVIHDYDPVHNAIADWVQLTTSGGSTNLSVDIDGTGGGHSMTQIATISGVTGLDLNTLIANGNLIVHA